MRPQIAAHSEVIGTEGVGGELTARFLVAVSSTRHLSFEALDFFIFGIGWGYTLHNLGSNVN
jgi:hypothetical protein